MPKTENNKETNTVEETIATDTQLDGLEPKGFDPAEYEGKDAVIEQIVFRDNKKSIYDSTKYLLVKSSVVGKYGNDPVVASEAFSVFEENGEVTGYPKTGKLAEFLAENNLTAIKDMIGLKVVTKVKVSKSESKKKYLGFIIVPKPKG